jgi:hypothetical protein
MVKGRRYSRKGLFRRQQVALYFSQKRRRDLASEAMAPGAGVDNILLEDGTSFLLLEDGSFLLME